MLERILGKKYGFLSDVLINLNKNREMSRDYRIWENDITQTLYS